MVGSPIESRSNTESPSTTTLGQPRHPVIVKMIHERQDRSSSDELTSTGAFKVEHKYYQSDSRVIPATFKVLPNLELLQV